MYLDKKTMKEYNDGLKNIIIRIHKFDEESRKNTYKAFWSMRQAHRDLNVNQTLYDLLEFLWELMSAEKENLINKSATLLYHPGDSEELMRKLFTESVEQYDVDSDTYIFMWIKNYWKIKAENRLYGRVKSGKYSLGKIKDTNYKTEDGENVDLLDLATRNCGEEDDDSELYEEIAEKLFNERDIRELKNNESEIIKNRKRGEFDLSVTFKRRLLLNCSKINSDVLSSIQKNELSVLAKRHVLLSCSP